MPTPSECESSCEAMCLDGPVHPAGVAGQYLWILSRRCKQRAGSTGRGGDQRFVRPRGASSGASIPEPKVASAVEFVTFRGRQRLDGHRRCRRHRHPLFELELFSTMNPYLAPRLGIDSRAGDNRGVCPKVDFEDARSPRRNPADSTSHRCLVRRLPSILLLLTRSIVSAPTPEQSGSSIFDDGFSRAL